MTDTQSFTPALGKAGLTPLYDAAIALATREGRWRARLLAQLAPRAGDRILDVGCGTGSFLAMIKTAAPEAVAFGLDPDANALALAQRKLHRRGREVTLHQGFVTDAALKAMRPLNKIAISLVLHQTPLQEKLRILNACRHALAADGELHIADYGEQRGLMRLAFRLTVQALDGVADTQPHADGALPDLMHKAGLKTVTRTSVTHTLTGAISCWRASR